MSDLTSKFDPIPGEDYGTCSTCGISVTTQADANSHMSETFEEAKAKGGSKGHGIRVTNPSRESRIEKEVRWLVEEALNRAMEEADDLVERGHASADEIREAFGWYSDFSDAWDEYLKEMGDA